MEDALPTKEPEKCHCGKVWGKHIGSSGVIKDWCFVHEGYFKNDERQYEQNGNCCRRCSAESSTRLKKFSKRVYSSHPKLPRKSRAVAMFKK